jgi:NDP-sugar pyrophosphorylase family protein
MDEHARAFAGIHVISPRIFAKLREEGAFSIVEAYVRLAAEGERIVGFDAGGAYWRDLGRLEDLKAAERELSKGATQD